MKKAYILAYQRATNYGAVLQIYALQKKLEEFDIDVEVIDYIPEWMKITLRNQPTIKSYIKRKIMNITFGKFFNQLNLTKKTFYSSSELKSHLQDGDLYFVGSDQVWNPKIMKNDTTYFLSFVSDSAKRIGYAISMGNQKLTNEFLVEALPLIDKFDNISTREVFVSDFIKNHYPSIKAPVVLDPTLLLDSEDYKNVKDRKEFKKDYIVVYAAMHDEKLYSLAKYLKEKTGLPIINLGYHFKEADVQEYIYGPGNWLNRIEQAKYIITNSFHGTVFSILYKKSFFVVPNQNQMRLNARFTELLNSLKLDSHLIISETDIDNKIYNETEFKQAFELLEERRESSLSYLEKAIKDD